MIIRNLTHDDLEQHEYVASLSFIYRYSHGDELEMTDGVFIGAFLDDNKTLTANMEVEDFEVTFNGQKLTCGGIGAVCTRPEYRRGGAVRKIFDAYFESEKHDISILYPFSTLFYRKLGYVNAGHYVNVEMPFANLSFIPRDFDVELYDGTQSEALYAFHNKNAFKTNLTFIRNNNRYFKDKPYEQLSYTYMGKNKNGVVDGYVTFRCDRPSSTVFVSELVYENKQSLFNLLAFLRTYDGNFKTLVIDQLTVWSPFFDILPNTAKDINRTMRDMGSVRIHNLEKILNMAAYPAEYGKFSFYSDDPIAKNHGIFDVEYENGKAKVSRREDGAYDVKLDAAAMSALVLLGHDGDYDALSYWQGVEIVNENPDLLRAFPKKRTYFADHF